MYKCYKQENKKQDESDSDMHTHKEEHLNQKASDTDSIDSIHPQVLQRAIQNPRIAHPNTIMQLHKMYGNQAVIQMYNQADMRSTQSQINSNQIENQANQEIESLSEVQDYIPCYMEHTGSKTRPSVISNEFEKPQPNKTGIPDTLKQRMETAGGVDLNDMRVKYPSTQPEKLGALAYTKGNEIHIAPGQMEYLPHETWHAVQQKQGRVKPTGKVENMPLNDNPGLENEANMMGSRQSLGFAGTLTEEPLSQRKLHRNNNDNTVDKQFNRTSIKAMDYPIQLKVLKYRAGAWYSDRDPYTIFITQRQAGFYDKQLREQGLSPLRPRVPTIYTYTHTKPANKLSFALQGPHTVAHRVILEALINAKTVEEVASIFNEQVLTPEDAEEVVFTDEAPPSGSFSDPIQARLGRYIEDYSKLYNNLIVELNKTDPCLIKIKHLTNQLLNLDPYAVYAWKTTTKASQNSIKGKSGESKVAPTWEELFDRPPASSFRDQENLSSFIDARKDLYVSVFKKQTAARKRTIEESKTDQEITESETVDQSRSVDIESNRDIDIEETKDETSSSKEKRRKVVILGDITTHIDNSRVVNINNNGSFNVTEIAKDGNCFYHCCAGIFNVGNQQHYRNILADRLEAMEKKNDVPVGTADNVRNINSSAGLDLVNLMAQFLHIRIVVFESYYDDAIYEIREYNNYNKGNSEMYLLFEHPKGENQGHFSLLTHC